MNDQLLTSEENEFDPLLLMDDLIVEIDGDLDNIESDDDVVFLIVSKSSVIPFPIF